MWSGLRPQDRAAIMVPTFGPERLAEPPVAHLVTERQGEAVYLTSIPASGSIGQGRELLPADASRTFLTAVRIGEPDLGARVPGQQDGLLLWLRSGPKGQELRGLVFDTR